MELRCFGKNFRTGQNIGNPIPMVVFLNGPETTLTNADGAGPPSGAGESCAMPVGLSVKVRLLYCFP